MFLNRFLAIFDGKSNITHYPDEMLRQAIERAVDATNPWLRGVSGYHKKLRPAIVIAIEHASALAASLKSPLKISPAMYEQDARLRAFFISTTQLQQVLNQDPILKEYRDNAPKGRKGGFALLMMEKEEKRTMGVDRIGGVMAQDVAQTTVSFSEHRFFDATGSEEETRNLLKRRAFDHLASLALTHITLANTQRTDLERQKKVLEAKLSTFQRGGFWQSALDSQETLSLPELEEQQKQLGIKLEKLGDSNDSLNLELHFLIDILSHPEKHLWATKTPLVLDRMGIKRSQATMETPQIELETLQNTRGRSVVVALVEFE